jgi:hypothetical protein
MANTNKMLQVLARGLSWSFSIGKRMPIYVPKRLKFYMLEIHQFGCVNSIKEQV